MNNWDYHILKQVGLWLVVFSPFALVLWIIYDHFRSSCFWFRHPWKFTKDLLFGKRYAVKINDVWSICRGKEICHGYYIKIKYGRDRHEWELRPSEFEEIKKRLNDKEAQQFVIEKNVKDLKRKHSLDDYSGGKRLTFRH